MSYENNGFETLLGKILWYKKFTPSTFVNEEKKEVVALTFLYGNNSTWYAIERNFSILTNKSLWVQAEDSNYDQTTLSENKEFLKELRRRAIRFRAFQYASGKQERDPFTLGGATYTFLSDEEPVAIRMLEKEFLQEEEFGHYLSHSKEMLDTLSYEDLQTVNRIIFALSQSTIATWDRTKLKEISERCRPNK